MTRNFGSVETSKKDLLSVLKIVAVTFNKRSSLPILKGIRIEYSDNSLKLVTTDFETVGKITIPVIGDELDDYRAEYEFKCVVGFEQFSKAVKSQVGKNVSMVYDDTLRTLSIGNYKLSVMNAEDYPITDFSKELPSEIAILNPDLLATMYTDILPGVSQDNSRPTLTGLYLKTHEDNQILECVGTDGFRLHRTVKDSSVFKSVTVVLPRLFVKASYYASKFIENSSQLAFYRDTNLIELTSISDTYQYQFVTKSIDGRYPDYTPILPKIENMMKISLPLMEVIDTIKSILSLRDTSGDGYHGIRFHINNEKRTMDVMSIKKSLRNMYCHSMPMDNNVSMRRTSVYASREEFETDVFSMNGFFVLDVLKNGNVKNADSYVHFYVIGYGEPIAIQVDGSDTEYVIMPMNEW